MKKTAALVLALFLLCLAPWAALADAAPSETDRVTILLPETIPWDATADEILSALEKPGEKPAIDSFADERMLGYMLPVEFAGYPAIFELLTLDADPLEFAVVIPEEGDTSRIFEALLAELRTVYGEPNSEDMSLLKASIAAIGGEIDNPVLFDAKDKYLWELPDGKSLLLAIDYNGTGFVVMPRADIS